MTGYATPPKFQNIGLSGESARWKVDTRINKTISDDHDGQKEGLAIDGKGRCATHSSPTEIT